MKKIIATVLAMVMALALCTTAFAADWTSKLSTVGDEETYLYYAEVKATCTTKGHGAYYTTLDDNDEVVYYREAAKTETEDVTVTFTNKKTVRLVTLADDDAKLGYVTPVYGHDLSKLSKNETATCTKDAYKKDTYKCADCGKYFCEDITDGFKNYEPNGLTVGNFNEIDTAAEKETTMISASHVLYPVTYEYDEMGQQVYKCVVCGATVAAKGKADANVSLFKTLYGVDALKFYNGSSVVVEEWCKENKTTADLKGVVSEGEYVYVTVTAAASTDTTDTTTTSPKTFDAGIAMYAGMALTSVAGSAVVIGKKKEF